MSRRHSYYCASRRCIDPLPLPSSHLQASLAAISRLAVGVNEAVRRREAVEKVVELEKRFVGTVELQASVAHPPESSRPNL